MAVEPWSFNLSFEQQVYCLCNWVPDNLGKQRYEVKLLVYFPYSVSIRKAVTPRVRYRWAMPSIMVLTFHSVQLIYDLQQYMDVRELKELRCGGEQSRRRPWRGQGWSLCWRRFQQGSMALWTQYVWYVCVCVCEEKDRLINECVCGSWGDVRSTYKELGRRGDEP